MYQMKLEFNTDEAAKAFDRYFAKLLQVSSQECAEPAFVMITSNYSADKFRRNIATDDPALLAKLSEITPV